MARKTKGDKEWRVFARNSPLEEATECAPLEGWPPGPYDVERAAVLAITVLLHGACEAFAINSEGFVCFRVID